MAPDPSPRSIGTERGCVEDQPQRVGSSKASGACSVLRLVEDDTAALRSNSAGEGRVRGHANSTVSGALEQSNVQRRAWRGAPAQPEERGGVCLRVVSPPGGCAAFYAQVDRCGLKIWRRKPKIGVVRAGEIR